MGIRIAQNDLGAAYGAHREEIEAAVLETLRSGYYILGTQVEAFEKEFGGWVEVPVCYGVGNGTDALEVALRACEIGAGQAVLTVSFTAVGTVAAIERTGASVVLADIEADTFTLDPVHLERTIAEYRSAASRRGWPPLAAIIVVHLYGHPADMPSILQIARREGLRVIEDCAQAHGASLGGKAVGKWGDLAAFSFYPTKNLGALGDGGAVVSREASFGEPVRLVREYGWRERYVSERAGVNSRLDEVQAAILRVKLRYLRAENERRGALAARYTAGLRGLGLGLPTVRDGAESVFHQYVVQVSGRDRLRAWLRERGVGSLVHYPAGVHEQPAYQGRVFVAEGGLPVSEQAAREVLSLPMHPQLRMEEVEEVCALVEDWVRAGG
jgi:dTDP-4-amino-4,6-dideoxygalactose transaminase